MPDGLSMEARSVNAVSGESTLVVVGLNHRSAAVEIRERFWVSEDRRYAALHKLVRGEGVQEAVILATCNRTEFILWATDPIAATESVRELLVGDFSLETAQWGCFYRLYDEKALAHVFRVTASLDSMVVGEPEITGQVKTAWARAQQAGTTGRYLDAVFQKALSVAKRVRNETSIGAAAVSVPYAAVELARQIFGSLDGRNVLVLGAGKMSELSARYLIANGASSLWVTNRTFENAVELATLLHGVAVPFEDRWRYLAQADIVLTSTGCPHVIIGREDAERMHREREGRPLFLIDIAVPRDIDPAVRQIPGVFLYDIDDLEQVVAHNLEGRQCAAIAAEKIVAAEAAAFRRKLAAERVVPTIVAVRQNLDEIQRQELERFEAEFGPFSEADARALDELATRIVKRISTQLARELKQVHEDAEQDILTAAIRQLFRLHRPQAV
ncbi:MAG TPA: glutamyl-tRNA reductase [Candidatus Acidoferrales bacterium]|jgi:glutamyl-tRNA reductase|nr:glutamyl-tRNA reductase [Candidatus Acidoferrales bacterium]